MTETQGGQEKTSGAGGCAGKMSLEHSRQISGKTSRQSSRKSSALPTQKRPLFLYLRKDGHTQDASWESMESGRWPTEQWMLNAGAFPNEEVGSTLSQILQERVDPKYYLSAKACLGILRRADKRGKPVIPILRQALERQAAIMAGGGQPLGTAYSLLVRSGCDGGGKGALVQTEKSATLSTHNVQTVFDPSGPLVLDNHPQDSRVTVRGDRMSPTLTEKMGTGGGNVPMIMEPVQICPIPIHNVTGAANGLGIGQPGDPAPTLTSTDRHSIAYGISRSFFNQGENAKYDPEITEEAATTLTTSHCPPGVACPLTVPEVSGTLTAKMVKGTGGPSGDETQNLVAEWPEYIVRRFTPSECCRLQGFPSWWAERLEVIDPPPGMVDRWVEIFKTHWRIVTSKDGVKSPKTRSQVIKWLKDPASDSALYKMWGNGIALPCAMFVMEGIEKIYRKEATQA